MGKATAIIDCNGDPCAVVTKQNPGESPEDFAARHRAAVEEQRQECAAGGSCGGSEASAAMIDGVMYVLTGPDAQDVLDALKVS